MFLLPPFRFSLSGHGVLGSRRGAGSGLNRDTPVYVFFFSSPRVPPATATVGAVTGAVDASPSAAVGGWPESALLGRLRVRGDGGARCPVLP